MVVVPAVFPCLIVVEEGTAVAAHARGRGASSHGQSIAAAGACVCRLHGSARLLEPTLLYMSSSLGLHTPSDRHRDIVG